MKARNIASTALLVIAPSPGLAVAQTGSAYIVSSSAPGIQVAATAQLPKAPADRSPATRCPQYAVAPESIGAQRAARNGWYVSSQTRVGPLDAVGLYAQVSEGTSGSCVIRDGSVAFFKGEALVAIAYDQNAGEGGSRTASIGPSTQRDTGYFYDLAFLNGPTASVTADSRHLSVVPGGGMELACAGRAQVPDVHGKPVKHARTELARFGWKPKSRGAPAPGSPVSDYWKQGLTEVEDCSGTGFGYCRASYINSAGVTLSITTLGQEELMVGDYAISCFEQSW